MSNAPFPLKDLPLDVILHVIETLGRADIHSLCLVSRSFDEIVTPVLYKVMTWSDEIGFVPPKAPGEDYLYVCTYL